MLVTFLGAPCSGKTTTAARVFADIQDAGYPAEFIAEQARLYIAKLRYACKQGGFEFKLTDGEQCRIMQGQLVAEQVFSSEKSLITITDSSVLNGMLYLQAEHLRNLQEGVVKTEANLVSVAFLCYPVKAPLMADPNRVHSEEESLKLHDSLKGLIEKYYSGVRVVPLVGDPNYRHREAMRAIYDELLEGK